MSLTHAIGASRIVNCAIVKTTLLFSVVALAILATLAIKHPNHPGNVESVVYALSLCACSLFSCLYTHRENAGDAPVLRQLDHAAIFLLIAGTYTPFAASDITGPFGVKLLPLIWTLALSGVILRMIIRHGYDRLFVALYIAIGWIFVTALHDVVQRVALQPMIFLGLGAVVYSVGAIIFARDVGRWTDPIWHGCVLLAGFLHFIAVMSLVLAA